MLCRVEVKSEQMSLESFVEDGVMPRFHAVDKGHTVTSSTVMSSVSSSVSPHPHSEVSHFECCTVVMSLLTQESVGIYPVHIPLSQNQWVFRLDEIRLVTDSDIYMFFSTTKCIKYIIKYPQILL